MKDEEEKRQIEIMQKAIEHWLDNKFAEFGRWSFYGIAAAVLAALTYFMITMSGYHK